MASTAGVANDRQDQHIVVGDLTYQVQAIGLPDNTFMVRYAPLYAEAWPPFSLAFRYLCDDHGEAQRFYVRGQQIMAHQFAAVCAALREQLTRGG